MTNNVWVVQELDPQSAAQLFPAGVRSVLSTRGEGAFKPSAGVGQDSCVGPRQCSQDHAVEDIERSGAAPAYAWPQESCNGPAAGAPRNGEGFLSGLDESAWAEASARAREGSLNLDPQPRPSTPPNLVPAAPAPAAGQSWEQQVPQRVQAWAPRAPEPTATPQPQPKFSAEPQLQQAMPPQAAPQSTAFSQNNVQTRGVPGPAAPAPASIQTTAAASNSKGKKAPVISVVSGRGGVGKTALVAAMASGSATLGLRTAVVDLDLMFGNLYSYLGADHIADISGLCGACAKGSFNEDELVRAGVRIGPGLTLWGPIAQPEQAELMGSAAELLIETLRQESDVVFVDSSTSWGDAVAAAVSLSSRCLIVGSQTDVGAVSSARAIELVARMGVPRTCMTSVLNRFGARGCDEEFAMRFEMTCALGSKLRLADGGPDVSSLLSFGRAADLLSLNTPFAKDLRKLTRNMLVELGCSPSVWPEVNGAGHKGERPALRLPWNKEAA